MKILIIGGTGVLSTDILQTSIGCGFDVSVLNRGNHNSQIPKEATIYKADIRKINEVDALLHGQSFDVIIDFLSFNAKEFYRTLKGNILIFTKGGNNAERSLWAYILRE